MPIRTYGMANRIIKKKERQNKNGRYFIYL